MGDLGSGGGCRGLAFIQRGAVGVECVALGYSLGLVRLYGHCVSPCKGQHG